MFKVKDKKYKQNITWDIEIKNKLTVSRGELGGDGAGKGGKGFQEHVQRTNGQSQRRVRSRVRSGDGWGHGEWWGENGDNCTWTIIKKWIHYIKIKENFLKMYYYQMVGEFPWKVRIFLSFKTSSRGWKIAYRQWWRGKSFTGWDIDWCSQTDTTFPSHRHVLGFVFLVYSIYY